MVTTEDKDSDGNQVIKKRSKSKRVFKEAMRKFICLYFSERAIEKQKTYLRNNLKKCLKRTCHEYMRCLKESNS